MTQFSGRGYALDRDSSRPLFRYRYVFKFLYVSVLIQASLCYLFFSLGVLFSLSSFHSHLIALYALFFSVVSFCYNISYKPIVDTVHLFFPKLEEDLVRHTFYFLLGIPGIFKSDSFQYQLGSILFALLGFVGTLLCFRDQNFMSSYMNSNSSAYEEV